MIALKDATTWASEVLMKKLNQIASQNQYRREPYHVLFFVKPDTIPIPANPNEVQTVNMENKRVFNQKIVIIYGPIPENFLQMGAMLFRIDNRLGTIKPVNILVPDWPTIPVEYSDESSETVNESVKRLKATNGN
jgi:hypothetical protein